MKFSTLLEMPTLIDKELDTSEDKVMIMSHRSLDREYDIIDHIKQGGEDYIVALRNDKKSAMVGRIVLRKDGEKAVEMFLTCSFKAGEYPIKGLKNALYVDTVVAASQLKGGGFGYQLYAVLAHAGYSVVSDNVQYAGGKALWDKIIRKAPSDGLVVNVAYGGEIAQENGKSIAFDGTNVDPDKVWSTDKKSETHYETTLVLRKR